MKHPVSDEVSKASFIQMLQLAATTNREMRAWWRHMVGTKDQSAIGVQPVSGRGERDMPPIGGHTISKSRYAQYQVFVTHRSALAR